MGKLDGKVVIVTGAARGLGRAYARRLAGLGAKLGVADLNLRSYEEFETEARDMTGCKYRRRDRGIRRDGVGDRGRRA
jgi:3-oxoacyl-[acyl-carrier protein] reductase